MLNQCQFIGRLGKDPEIRVTQSGDEIANFSLACSESWKDKSGSKQERTEWVRVVVFSSGLVSVVKNYLKKGDVIFVQGKMQTRKWQDKSGNDKYTTEIVLGGFDGKITMLGGGKTADEKSQPSLNDDLEDEIPF